MFGSKQGGIFVAICNRTLATKVAAQTGLSIAQAKRVLHVVWDEIQYAVELDERVVITGFGVFSQTQRKGRRFKKIGTLEDGYAKPVCTLYFKPSKKIRFRTKVE